MVAWRNGAPVRLQDIATVRDGTEDERTGAWTYDKPDGGKAAINLDGDAPAGQQSDRG